MVRRPESDADVRNFAARGSQPRRGRRAEEAWRRRGSPIQHFEHLSRKLKTFHQSTMFKLIVALCASSAVAFQSAMPMARAT